MNLGGTNWSFTEIITNDMVRTMDALFMKVTVQDVKEADQTDLIRGMAGRGIEAVIAAATTGKISVRLGSRGLILGRTLGDPLP